jgi:excisionase family DNA binding protein
MDQGSEGTMEKEKNEVLTTNEASEYLRISRPTLLKLFHTKQIKARKAGRAWKVLISELSGFFEMEETGEQGHVDRAGCRENEVADAIDQDILRILSRYEHLAALQVWYELGEEQVIKGGVTEEEITNRLEHLVARG